MNIFQKTQLLLCGNPLGIVYGSYGKYSQFFFKSNFQYLDYFKDHELAKGVRDDINFNFNHCYFYGEVLKEAHKGNQVAKDILASMPTSGDEVSEILKVSRYVKSITRENF